MANYWTGWPYKGEYVNDCLWAYNVGSSYLKQYQQKQTAKPKCVIFDIDDTLVFGDPEQLLGVKEMEMGTFEGQDIFLLPVNTHIVKLAEYAKFLKYQIIVLTARPTTSYLASKENLIRFKIPYDVLLMNDKDEDPSFKINVRRRVSKKYDIALTIGDQITDLFLPGTAACIKLPDPHSKASYAWLPPLNI
jgi:predicted secreted acid phosphatase